MPGFKKRRRFLLDVESTSEVNLTKAGAAAYWAHPSTQIIWVCYRVDDGPVIKWRPGDSIPYFAPELDHGHFRVVAHNWLFEYYAWLFHLMPIHKWPLPGIKSWDCTMARASYWGLPMGLGDLCEALNLPVQKDASARALMLRMSKPRSFDPVSGNPVWWHETDPEKLKDLGDYCETDVLAECAADDALPELPDREREIFLMDGEINMRGVMIDLPMVNELSALTNTEGVRLSLRMNRLTGGVVKTTNQVAEIGRVLAAEGCPVPDLTRATVAAMLARQDIPAKAREILLIRQEAAKASTAKLSAMLAGADTRDAKCRGLLQYGGAGRTLRWAGRRVQPQNYPRGTLKGLSSVFAMVEAGASVDELSALLPGTVMDAVSSMLRGCMIPSPGYVFASGDLSQIEARVLPWLAGQGDVLSVFARGEDVYAYTAAKLGSTNRQFGKVLVLACGFGMGPARFQETAATYGVDLDISAAEEAVYGWRDNNQKIVALWWAVDRAFRTVAAGPHGCSVQVGEYLTIRKTRKAVRIVLPAPDKELTYQNVELVADGEFQGRDEITYMGVHPKTKKWTRLRTYGGKLVENITQAVARDVMAESMLAQRRKQVRIVLTVHDELLVELPQATATAGMNDLLKDMRTTPAWAPGLPVNADGWTGKRYRK